MGLFSQREAWDGRRIVLEKVRTPLAVCSRDGVLLGLSPPAREIFERVGIAPSKLPVPLVPELHQKLEAAGPETQVDWHPPGTDRCLGVTYYPLGSEHVLLSMQEITDRKTTLSQSVYRSTQDVFARLLLGTAHDLRSPLSSMTFNIEVLRRRWREMEPERIDALLDQLAEGCQRELAAVDALLDRARPSSSGQTELGQLFDRISELLGPRFREGENQLKLAIERGVEVRGTELTLEHIFVNLINNACDAADGAAKIQVWSASRHSADEGISLHIVDDGPGIPPAARASIFDPFFSTKSHGSGLGLCLAREAAREIGGDLRLLEPAEGEGAHFEVRLRLGARRHEAA